MEFASVDPKLRTIFYTLDQEQSGTPRLQRRTTDCVLCHDGASTGGVPGLMVRSSIPTTKATRSCEPELSLPQITALGASVGVAGMSPEPTVTNHTWATYWRRIT